SSLPPSGRPLGHICPTCHFRHRQCQQCDGVWGLWEGHIRRVAASLHARDLEERSGQRGRQTVYGNYLGVSAACWASEEDRPDQRQISLTGGGRCLHCHSRPPSGCAARWHPTWQTSCPSASPCVR